jgi:gamma-glutamyltranspeptidase/glutathione hydrolase
MARGMIVAPQPEAVEAGAEIFKMGGNAVDAAIACALVQGVVDPLMTGIAGFGSLHIYMPGRNAHAIIDCHGRVPASGRPDMWADLIEGEARDGFGFILKGRVNDIGYQAIATPGNLKAYFEAQSEFGSLPWKDVIKPAIAHADAGFVVRPGVHAFWVEDDGMGRVPVVDRLRFSETGRRIFFGPDGELLPVGARVKNPDMARTLRRIADTGAEDFYTGELAHEIAADMKAGGGLITLEDLKSYRTRRTEPLWGDYRGYRVATNRPPGGGIMLIEMMNILENFDLTALGHNTVAYIRTVAETMKRATSDKDRHVGDPDFFDVPVARLTDKAYARELAAQIKRGEKARVERLEKKPEAADTTHISAIDSDGNAVSMTHTLGMPSGAITQGLGFMYNGAMGVFDPRPGRAGSIVPGKSRFSSMCPSIVFKDGKPHLVIGAPGGTQIVMGVMQAILNVLDHGMSILEAIAAPRFSATSDMIDVSNRIPTYVTRPLEAEGYAVVRNPRGYVFASVHGLKIDGGKWTGAADPGRDGMALEV